MKRELTALLNWWHFPTGTYATLAATAVIVAAVVGVAMYPALVLCGFVIVCVAFVGYPR